MSDVWLGMSSASPLLPGIVLVVSGADGSLLRYVPPPSDRSAIYFGESVEPGGDIDADGTADILVTVWNPSSAERPAGAELIGLSGKSGCPIRVADVPMGLPPGDPFLAWRDGAPIARSTTGSDTRPAAIVVAQGGKHMSDGTALPWLWLGSAVDGTFAPLVVPARDGPDLLMGPFDVVSLNSGGQVGVVVAARHDGAPRTVQGAGLWAFSSEDARWLWSAYDRWLPLDVRRLPDCDGDGVEEVASALLRLTPSGGKGKVAVLSSATGKKLYESDVVPTSGRAMAVAGLASPAAQSCMAIAYSAERAHAEVCGCAEWLAVVVDARDGQPHEITRETVWSETVASILATAGDVDSDGSSDLIVGHWQVGTREREVIGFLELWSSRLDAVVWRTSSAELERRATTDHAPVCDQP